MTNFIFFGFNKNMDNISFQSRIRITDRNGFRNIVNRQFAYVNYPWTLKEGVCAQKARTDAVYDCTVFGVTDGEKVLMEHLCPTVKDNQDFHKIAASITEKIKTHLNLNDLQGFILGSKPHNINSSKSTPLFDMLEELFIKLNIEYSKFKGGKYTNNVAYDSTKDEWIIGSELLDEIPSKETLFKNPQKAAEKIFDEIKIANCDDLSW